MHPRVRRDLAPLRERRATLMARHCLSEQKYVLGMTRRPRIDNTADTHSRNKPPAKKSSVAASGDLPDGQISKTVSSPF
jgi:hypothetical protein